MKQNFKNFDNNDSDTNKRVDTIDKMVDTIDKTVDTTDEMCNTIKLADKMQETTNKLSGDVREMAKTETVITINKIDKTNEMKKKLNKMTTNQNEMANNMSKTLDRTAKNMETNKSSSKMADDTKNNDNHDVDDLNNIVSTINADEASIAYSKDTSDYESHYDDANEDGINANSNEATKDNAMMDDDNQDGHPRNKEVHFEDVNGYTIHDVDDDDGANDKHTNGTSYKDANNSSIDDKDDDNDHKVKHGSIDYATSGLDSYGHCNLNIFGADHHDNGQEEAEGIHELPKTCLPPAANANGHCIDDSNIGIHKETIDNCSPSNNQLGREEFGMLEKCRMEAMVNPTLLMARFWKIKL